MCKYFKFHSNLDVSQNQIKNFRIYYQQMFQKESTYLSFSPILPSSICLELSSHNRQIKIDNKSIFNSSVAATLENLGANALIFNKFGAKFQKTWFLVQLYLLFPKIGEVGTISLLPSSFGWYGAAIVYIKKKIALIILEIFFITMVLLNNDII